MGVAYHSLSLRLAQQLRQLGDIRRDPPRLISGEQFRRRATARFILEIDVSQFLPDAVGHENIISTALDNQAVGGTVITFLLACASKKASKSQ